MAKVVVTDLKLVNVADAIRRKKGVEITYTLDEMPDAIDSISGEDTEFIDAVYAKLVKAEPPTKQAGIYSLDDGSLLYSWQDMIDNEWIAVDGTTLKRGSKASAFTKIVGKLIIDDSITSVELSVFLNCKDLVITELPSGIISIGMMAFSGCTNLVLTELPNGLTSIDMYAFKNCTQLSITELPSALAIIYQGAFTGCVGLTTITFKSLPTAVYGDSFNGCTNLKDIYVPWSSAGYVLNAPWGATNATIHYNTV